MGGWSLVTWSSRWHTLYIRTPNNFDIFFNFQVFLTFFIAVHPGCGAGAAPKGRLRLRGSTYRTSNKIKIKLFFYIEIKYILNMFKWPKSVIFNSDNSPIEKNLSKNIFKIFKHFLLKLLVLTHFLAKTFMVSDLPENLWQSTWDGLKQTYHSSFLS